MPTTPSSGSSPGPLRRRAVAVRDFFVRSLAGRLLTLGAAIKSLALVLTAAGLGSVRGIEGVSTFGGIALLVGIGMLLYRLGWSARRHMLWRVRRKLIISYLFIGVVPAILIVTFFMLSGLLFLTNLSSYLIRSALGDLASEAASIARVAAVEVGSVGSQAAIRETLERRVASGRAQFPAISLAVVPVNPSRCAPPGTASGTSSLSWVTAGAWQHVSAPGFLPSWIPCDGFAGVLAYAVQPDQKTSDAGVFVRAVAFPEHAPGFAVVADVPFAGRVKSRVEEATGIVIGQASFVSATTPALQGQASPPSAGPASAGAPAAGDGTSQGSRRFEWVAQLDHVDWINGKTDQLTLKIVPSIPAIYQRLSASQARSLGALLLGALAFVSVLFLIIEVGALVMGLALARSITGAVHELFAGTERVRQGDFGHRIPVLANDQLGELANSFNQMTGSIEDLLRQAAEKKRLEEEMRLAREIQMSLLPRGPLLIPGIAISALCVPAREVGGDYYDILPLPDGRYGLLIADVSGKGMSAALYMAELKGLILSLSQIHRSPRDLLIAANRLISMHLDSRSFITMTYAVIDPAAGVMTYARAGHTPLLYLPGDGGAGGRTQILVPDGLVLGLRIDDGERFEALLVEATLHLSPGDLLVLFTDGISEAMNEHADCFGESQLADLIEEHGHLAIAELRERVLREIDAFVGGAPQHDDMTMILLKVDAPAAT
jgi:sigma-B regulation protein RsbU (phosphoserine phosphatase)